MSAKYFTTFFKVNDEKQKGEVIDFISMIKRKDWESIFNVYGRNGNLVSLVSIDNGDDRQKAIDKIKHYFEMDIVWKEEGGLFELVYDTFTSFDEELFSSFLMDLGAERVESIYDDSGCGEYGFVLNGEYHESYTDCEWIWIKEPLSLEGKNVVFTGKLKGGTREEMAGLAEEFGATVQKEVNSKTNYLIVGDNVGEKKISKASSLGVTVITETEFLKAVGEFV